MICLNEDMAEMFKNFRKMMNNQEIPDNVKNIMNNMNTNNTTNENNQTDTKTANNPFGNIDINTIMKMQQIMSSMNDKQNDSRTNLLLSLKPYLKESRKNKVDQYIQLMKMEKIFEIMNPLGGDSKHV